MVETKGPTGPEHGPAPSLWPLGFAVGLTRHPRRPRDRQLGSRRCRRCLDGRLRARLGARRDERRGVGLRSSAAPAPAQAVVVDVDEEEPETYGRGTFLGLTTLGLGGVISGLVALPGCRLRGGCPRSSARGTTRSTSARLTTTPRASSSSPPSSSTLSRARAPAAPPTSGTTAFKDGLPSFTILSNCCVHLGCPVQVERALAR